MAYNEKGLVRISDSALRLILPTQLRKTIQIYQIIFGCYKCIQAGTWKIAWSLAELATEI